MDKAVMDSDTISSPVDPELPEDSTAENPSNDNDVTVTATPSTHHDDIFDDDDIDSILRQNQKFIEEHSIDPVLNDIIDIDDKSDDNTNEESHAREDNEKKKGSDDHVQIQEGFVVKETSIPSHTDEVKAKELESELDKNFDNSPVIESCEKEQLNRIAQSNSLENEEANKNETSGNELQPKIVDLKSNLDLVNEEAVEINNDDSIEISEEPILSLSATSSHHSDPMAEPEQETSFAPCADCKYRWSKVVETNSPDVGFYPSYSKGDPILLSWDSALKAYYSVDQKVVCGDYHGNVVVDGNVFPVEPFNVRSYTFEVDLFMKDDVVEEEVKPLNSVDQQSVEPVEQNSNSNMDNSSKEVEPISTSNMDSEKKEVTAQSTEDFINSVTSSLKFENLTKRHSPVGDDAVKSYNEFSPIKNGTDEHSDKSWSGHDKVRDDGEKRPSSRSSNISKHNEVVDDIISNPPSLDVSRISNSSNRSLMEREKDSKNIRSVSGSPLQREGSSTDAIYGRPLSSSSDRYPLPARPSSRPSSDVDGKDKDEPKAALSSLSRHTPTRDITPTHSRPPPDASFGRERVVENGDHPSSNRPPSHPSSRHGSNHPSRAQSLSSITSEQELGQYMGHGSRSSSVDRSGPAGDNGLGDDYHRSSSSRHRDGSRPTSAHSYSQQQHNSDARSTTPDNRIRVPESHDLTALRGGILSDRLESESMNLDRASILSNAGSRASSRTITPSYSERENFSPQVKDLEDSVANLRKLLTKREAEVHSLQAKIADLKDINRSLKDDLEHAKRHRPGTNEDTILELKQTIAEKEILATEVVSLRDEIQRLRVGSGRRSGSSEISDYSPNSPSVLQRKIVDLESHMKDLQEAHESATSKLGKAESRIKSLQDENKDLKSCSLSIADLQEVGGHNLRVEMVTLREDLRSLKERNFQLTEENMRLSENTKGRSESGLGGDNKLSSSFRSDDGVIQSQQNSHYREKNYRPSYSNYTESRSALPNQYKLSRQDLAPKDLRLSSSERIFHESNSRPLLQRDNIEQSRIRYAPKKDNIHTLEATKSSVLYADRSMPDGEISEKLQSQRISDVSSYERTLMPKERSPRVHSNIHDFRPRDYSNKEGRSGDRLLSDRFGADASDREYQARSSGSALNSKEIFFNLKQKRANQWLQQDKYVSGNLQGHRGQVHRDSPRSLYTDDLADDSDTATDILLAQDSGPRESSNMRPPSPVESLSSLSDGDNGESGRLRRRSKSVEFNRSQNGSSTRLLRSGSATRPLNSMDSSSNRSLNTSGLRSVLPAPLVTQHNKNTHSSSTSSLLNSTLTQGMRPFAPCNPSDVRSGDVVKFSRVGGKLTQGIVKYVGHLPGRSDAYLGVELDKDEGKHDGTFEGIRYFKCKPSKGVFVAFNKIVMAWAP